MRSKLVCLVLLLAMGVASSGCMSGPHRLRKSWEDKTTEWYSHNAWVHGALLQDILPVYPIVTLFMALGDILVLNVYYFWGSDAWTNEGTVHVHTVPTGPNTKDGFFLKR